jgi:hypothetical protein
MDRKSDIDAGEHQFVWNADRQIAKKIASRESELVTECCGKGCGAIAIVKPPAVSSISATVFRREISFLATAPKIS